MVPLKYLSNVWRTLEMLLISCEINIFFNLVWTCFIVAGTDGNQELTFATTDAKLFVPAVTLSTQDNAQQPQQLKTDFKRRINCNQYQSEAALQTPSWYFKLHNCSTFSGKQ